MLGAWPGRRRRPGVYVVSVGMVGDWGMYRVCVDYDSVFGTHCVFGYEIFCILMLRYSSMSDGLSLVDRIFDKAVLWWDDRENKGVGVSALRDRQEFLLTIIDHNLGSQ